MFAYCNNNPVNMVDSNGTFAISLTAVGIVALAALFVGGCQMMYSITNSGDNGLAGCVVDIYNDLTYTPPIVYNSKLPNQGPVSEIPDAPEVDAGKQGKHVPGHPNDDPSKSQWRDGETGVKETQEAWQSGIPVKPDGSVRIGNSRDGRRIKVHRDGSGRIHGYPVPDIK